MPNRVLGDFASDVDASDPQLLPRAVVALHQHADGVSSGFDVEDARTGADTAFEFIADHSRAAADVSFFDRAGMGGVERVPGIFRLHVESIDVVQVPVPGFGHDR